MREIVTYPADVLRQKARPVDLMVDDLKYLQSVAKDLYTVVERENGLGLAAPQLGESIRMFLMRNKDKSWQLVMNPTWEAEGTKMIDGLEGCLSIPGPHNQVSRYAEISVNFTNLQGVRMGDTLEGLEARVFQHEFDHLNGVMFIDRMSRQARKATLRAYEKGYHGRV